MFDMTGKNVVITGANRGIGLGIAEGFLEAGATVCIIALEEDVLGVAEELSKKYERTVKGVQCDISKRSDVIKLSEAIDCVDVLINNAGLEFPTPVADHHPNVSDMFRKIMEINVTGTFDVIRALLPKIPNGGRIINTSSIWGKTAVAEYSAYCASKHAIIGLTRSLSKELGPQNISVNAVCPGWVRTEASMRSLSQIATREDRAEEDLLQDIVAAQSIDGLMDPKDMADMYLYLASDAARNITGQSYTVDRGELMQ